MKMIKLNKDNYTKKVREYLSTYKKSSFGPGIDILTFSDLIKEVANLSFLNQEYMLFYRGQKEDYQNITNTSSSLYPSIYRDRVNDKFNNLNLKILTLNRASELLVEEVKKRDIIGKEEIIKKKHVQWSILQHYEICDTPLLDLTHSLRVACSFALENNDKKYGYVYVLGLPYVTHRISTNSEQETIIVRLLSISPPQALRPYYQDGYMVGTEFITDNFENKQELDLTQRLIAKYRIKNVDYFWDQDTKKIPNNVLYPDDDKVFLDISRKIKEGLTKPVIYNETEELFGKFMINWIKIETFLKKSKEFRGMQILNPELNKDIKQLRYFRNNIVHNIIPITIDDLNKYNNKIQTVINELNL